MILHLKIGGENIEKNGIIKLAMPVFLYNTVMNRKIDQKLNIETQKIVQYYSDSHHNRYEATHYRVLDEILKLNLIREDDVVVDYGCGKGRVDFYFSYRTGCKCKGIEYNEDMFLYANENLKSSFVKNVEFILCDAVNYVVQEDETIFYFFNPFSVSILRKVMNHILDSFYCKNRRMILIFYYPNSDYVSYLMNLDDLNLKYTIDTNFIFSSNSLQEKVLIFEING